MTAVCTKSAWKYGLAETRSQCTSYLIKCFKFVNCNYFLTFQRNIFITLFLHFVIKQCPQLKSNQRKWLFELNKDKSKETNVADFIVYKTFDALL